MNRNQNIIIKNIFLSFPAILIVLSFIFMMYYGSCSSDVRSPSLLNDKKSDVKDI